MGFEVACVGGVCLDLVKWGGLGKGWLVEIIGGGAGRRCMEAIWEAVW